jgi:hypothetical protein
VARHRVTLSPRADAGPLLAPILQRMRRSERPDPPDPNAGSTMTTIRKAEANRRNAQRSSGPTTAAGRRISSKNALKHGLTAREVTVDEAEAKNFAAFRDDLVADRAPVGALEEQLVEEIAICSWRLRRVYRLEVDGSDDSNPLSSLAKETTVSGSLVHHTLSFGTLLRYEVSIARLRERALHDLERLQARRRGQVVDAPIVVDVTHSTADGAEIGEAQGRGAPRTDACLPGDQGSAPERSDAAPVKPIRVAQES